MRQVTIGRVTSATMTVDNSADAGCKYDVRGSVTVSDGKARNIGEGQVLRRDASDERPASTVANFHFYNHGQKTVTFTAELTPEEEAEVMTAINDFLAGVDAAAAGMEITANV